MREIKFRAWKKSNSPEMYIKVTSIDFKKREIGLGYRVSSWMLREDVEKLDNVVLMQYTGLKDKNRVEIYEGDIVNHDDGENSYIGIVKNDLFYFYVDGIEPNDSFDFLDVSDTSDGTTELTVIGNIYENQELLNGDSSFEIH